MGSNTWRYRRHMGSRVLHRGRARLLEAVERASELYDRVGTAIGGALKRLSVQYGMEQRRHFKQVEAYGGSSSGRPHGARKADERTSETPGCGQRDTPRAVAGPPDLMRQLEQDPESWSKPAIISGIG